MHTDFHGIRGIANWIAAIVLLGVIPPLPSQGIPSAQQIQIESALVSVPVIVTDSQGKFVPGLDAGAFTLFQDGIRTPFSLFLTSQDPIRIALLLDTSKSTTTVLGNIRKAAKRFLLQMRSHDQAMVVSFDSDVRVLCPLSADRKELEEGIQKAEAGGTATKMRDAVVEIAQHRFRSIPGRTAIVLLTDGQDHGSAISSTDLFDAIAASGTLIYTVFYRVDPRELAKELFGVKTRSVPSGTQGDKGPRSAWDEDEERAARYLQQLSELSAGRFYRGTAAEFDAIFKQISDELRAQYLIGFYPDKTKLDGTMHSLDVRVDSPGATVRSRRSYRAARESVPAQ